MKKSIGEVVRLGIVSIVTNGSAYALYCLLTFLGTTPKLTMSFLYICCVLIGFIGNRQYTFSHTGSFTRAALRYLIAQGIGYLICLGLFIFMVDNLGWSHQIIQLIAFVIVSIFLYFAFKFYVFKQNDYNF